MLNVNGAIYIHLFFLRSKHYVHDFGSFFFHKAKVTRSPIVAEKSGESLDIQSGFPRNWVCPLFLLSNLRQDLASS